LTCQQQVSVDLAVPVVTYHEPSHEVLTAQVGGHDNHRVGKVDGAALQPGAKEEKTGAEVQVNDKNVYHQQA
jgi:hypothetical protein